MKLLELTLPTAAENVALDEALLLSHDVRGPGVLRIWESPAYAVVIGRASKIADEANLPWCETQRIPIIRRTSGGASILMGPGCLMYSLVLSPDRHPAVATISSTHEYVLTRMVDSISRVAANVQVAGTSDLVVASGDQRRDWLKFSGNSMRKSRNAVLYHGTLLYNFDLDCVRDALLSPPRTPEYRQGRSHREFITNLSVRRSDLVHAVREAWLARETLTDWPRHQTQELVVKKYATTAWNQRR